MVGNIVDIGNKWGKGFGKRPHIPTHFFWEYPPNPAGGKGDFSKGRLIIRGGS